MVTALQMGETTDDVSYVEKLSPAGEVMHPVYFDMQWLTKVALAIANRAELSVDTAPLSVPPIWWVNEGRAQDLDQRGKKRP